MLYDNFDWILSDSYWIPIGFHRIPIGFHRIPIGSLSESNWIPTRFLLNSYWIPNGFPWIPIRFRWVPIGFQEDSNRIPNGFLSDSKWIPIGFLLDSYWSFRDARSEKTSRVASRCEARKSTDYFYLGHVPRLASDRLRRCV